MPMTSRGRPLTSIVCPTMSAAAERGLPQLVREHARSAAAGRRRAGVGGGPVRSASPLREQPALASGCTPSAVSRPSSTAADRTRSGAIAGREVHLAGRERADGRERLIDLAELEILRRRHPELSRSRTPGTASSGTSAARASDTPSGRRITPLTIEKIAVLAPMPSASVRIVTTVKAGRAQQAADGVAKVLAKMVEGHGVFDVLERRRVDMLNGVSLRATDRSRTRSERQTDRVRILQTPPARRAGRRDQLIENPGPFLASGCCDRHRLTATVQARRAFRAPAGDRTRESRGTMASADTLPRPSRSHVPQPGCRNSRRHRHGWPDEQDHECRFRFGGGNRHDPAGLAHAGEANARRIDLRLRFSGTQRQLPGPIPDRQRPECCLSRPRTRNCRLDSPTPRLS